MGNSMSINDCKEKLGPNSFDDGEIKSALERHNGDVCKTVQYLGKIEKQRNILVKTCRDTFLPQVSYSKDYILGELRKTNWDVDCAVATIAKNGSYDWVDVGEIEVPQNNRQSRHNVNKNSTEGAKSLNAQTQYQNTAASNTPSAVNDLAAGKSNVTPKTFSQNTPSVNVPKFDVACSSERKAENPKTLETGNVPDWNLAKDINDLTLSQKVDNKDWEKPHFDTKVQNIYPDLNDIPDAQIDFVEEKKKNSESAKKGKTLTEDQLQKKNSESAKKGKTLTEDQLLQKFLESNRNDKTFKPDQNLLISSCQEKLKPLEFEKDFLRDVLLSMNWDVDKVVKHLIDCNQRQGHNVKIIKSGDRLHFKKERKQRLPRRMDLSQKYEEIKKITDTEKRIIEYARAKICVVVFLRGCPGSGRTTQAKRILHQLRIRNTRASLITADDYFYDQNNCYKFTANALPAAHNWNKQVLQQLMFESRSPIFVDNIHLQVWEMKEAAEMAVAANYIVETLEPNTPWRYDERALSTKNTHKVGINSIKRLLERFEKNMSGEELLQKLNLRYESVPRSAYPRHHCSRRVKYLLKNKQAKACADLSKDEHLVKIYYGIKDIPDTAQRIFMYAKSRICVMIFLRGCPGSGKTTFAQNILNALNVKNHFEHIFSADDYFTNFYTGVYNYSKMDISAAHEWNRKLVLHAVMEGRSPIFVDNTHLELWEMLDNAKVGAQNSYVIETLEPSTPWKYNAQALSKHNRHGVTIDIIKRCLDRFDRIISGEDITKKLKFTGNPPTLAKIPLNTPLNADMYKLLQSRNNVANFRAKYPEPLVQISDSKNTTKNTAIDIAETGKKWSYLQDLIGLDLSEAWKESESDSEESDSGSLIASLSTTSDFQENLIDLDYSEDENIQHLCLMFPTVEKSDLQVVFDHYKTIDTTVKVLLENGAEVSKEYLESVAPDIPEEKKELPVQAPKKKQKKKKEMSEEAKKLIKNIESSFTTEIPVNKYKEVKNVPYKTDMDASDDEFVKPGQEFVQLKLDKNFVLQLHEKFATLINPQMINEKTMVDVPIELAQQLHAYTVESVYRDIEYEESLINMLKEESLLDLPIGEVVEEKVSPPPPSLMEIMDSEIAQRISNHEKKQEETLASKLSLNLLSERFPTIDKSVLPSILAEMNNSLHQTTSLFIHSGHSPQLPQQPSSSKDDFHYEFLDYCSPEEALVEADHHRAVAEQLFLQRRECISKAQNSSGRGNAATMQYYLQMVDWYKQLMEKANSMAAKAMLKGYEGASTLDLHTLSVAEATTVLDLFLDEHIRILKDKNLRKEILYIITGRGAHSVGGKPKIKHVAIQRLSARSILYEEENPGMLKITINRSSHHLKNKNE